MNTIEIQINGIDYTQYLVSPNNFSNLLDEQLDIYTLRLIQVNEPIFICGSNADIRILDGISEKIEHYIITEDKAERKPNGKYNHNLTLMECTVELEGQTCESLDFTNTLGNTYADNTFVVPTIKTTVVNNIRDIGTIYRIIYNAEGNTPKKVIYNNEMYNTTRYSGDLWEFSHNGIIVNGTEIEYFV